MLRRVPKSLRYEHRGDRDAVGPDGGRWSLAPSNGRWVRARIQLLVRLDGDTLWELLLCSGRDDVTARGRNN